MVRMVYTVYNFKEIKGVAPIAHMFSDITEAQQAAVWQH